MSRRPTIREQISDMLDNLTPEQQTVLLHEMLETMATGPDEYASASDWRVDVMGGLEELRDEYAMIARQQGAIWQAEEMMHARSDYRALTTERGRA